MFVFEFRYGKKFQHQSFALVNDFEYEVYRDCKEYFNNTKYHGKEFKLNRITEVNINPKDVFDDSIATKIIKRLIRNNAEIEDRDKELVLKYDIQTLTKDMMYLGFDCNKLMLNTIRDKRYDILKFLLKNKTVDPTYFGDDDTTSDFVLDFCTKNGDIECLRILLSDKRIVKKCKNIEYYASLCKK